MVSLVIIEIINFVLLNIYLLSCTFNGYTGLHVLNSVLNLFLGHCTVSILNSRSIVCLLPRLYTLNSIGI